MLAVLVNVEVIKKSLYRDSGGSNPFNLNFSRNLTKKVKKVKKEKS